MVRILQIVTHMNRGGLETMLMNYYRNIDRTKVQFDFLTHRPYDGDYGDEIRSLGGEIYHLPMLNPFSREYRSKLRDFFISHPEYKIIHVHQDCMSGLILKIAKECGIKVRIAHSHNSKQDINFKYPIKLFYKRIIAIYATDLMACGKKAGIWMFGNHDFSVLNNAIDTEQYIYQKEISSKVRKSFQIGENTILFGHVGRFCPQKNHIYLIELFKVIKERIPDSKLILVGDATGDIASKVKGRIDKYNLKEDVIFTGIRSDVNELLQAMDVFLFPSIYEGLPVTLIEAQASGLPCLISDKVPIECKISDLVTQLSLSDSPNFWANKAIKIYKTTKRKNMMDIISASGFDINNNAIWLQDFYLNKVGLLREK